MPRIGMSRVHGSAAGVAGAGWFGDGSDGDLTVAAGQTLALDVAEDEGQIVKQYGNLTIEAGGVLKPANRCNGMILLVNGDLTVHGTISVSKCAPLLNGAEARCLEEPHIKLCGDLIGGNGGKGGSASAAGGIGGKGHALGGGFPGGGGASGGNAIKAGGPGEPRPPHGITWPYPGTIENGLYSAGGGAYSRYRGGDSPGGGGASTLGNGYAGDGHPGGALWIFVKGDVVITATGIISADGGDGGAASLDGGKRYGGSGGGAGGGIIALVHGGAISILGSVHANGGRASTLASSNGVGDDGGIGTVFIKTISELM